MNAKASRFEIVNERRWIYSNCVEVKTFAFCFKNHLSFVRKISFSFYWRKLIFKIFFLSFILDSRPMRAVITDVPPKIPTVSKSHDCGSLSRVVMVRKTDHRMINHKKPESVSRKSSFWKKPQIHQNLALLLISLFLLLSCNRYRIHNVNF